MNLIQKNPIANYIALANVCIREKEERHWKLIENDTGVMLLLKTHRLSRRLNRILLRNLEWRTHFKIRILRKG